MTEPIDFVEVEDVDVPEEPICWITGQALPAEGTTTGASTIEKEWPIETQHGALESLVGSPVVDRRGQRRQSMPVGQVTSATVDPVDGTNYEAVIYDSDVATQLRELSVDVAPKLFHECIDDPDGPYSVEDATYEALGVYPEVVNGIDGVRSVEHIDNGVSEVDDDTP